tara:strand:- start:113 stop:1048 length:936 start_codon:yes stop_codon:yes gene_type:complete
MTKQFRSLITTGVIITVLGILGLLTKEDLYEYFGFYPFFVITFSILLVLVGVAAILNVYVKGGFANNETTHESRLFREELKMMRNEFYHQFDRLSNLPTDEQKIESQINEKIDRITEKSLFKKVDDKYKDLLLEEKTYNLLEDEFSDIKYRIEREVSRLSRYGLINLMLGFITTFMAIFFLAYSLNEFNEPSYETSQFVYKFIPRLSLSILIELFSFFFLRMYRKNLEDLKYLNNEKTNVEMQLLSLKTAIVLKDNEAISKVIDKMSSTERNFVLKKDETTVETQKSRMDNDSNTQIISQFFDLLKQKIGS